MCCTFPFWLMTPGKWERWHFRSVLLEPRHFIQVRCQISQFHSPKGKRKNKLQSTKAHLTIKDPTACYLIYMNINSRQAKWDVTLRNEYFHGIFQTWGGNISDNRVILWCLECARTSAPVAAGVRPQDSCCWRKGASWSETGGLAPGMIRFNNRINPHRFPHSWSCLQSQDSQWMKGVQSEGLLLPLWNLTMHLHKALPAD